ncbi:MAG: hypothetical protein WCP04_15345 [Pseudomonadota bacterium]
MTPPSLEEMQIQGQTPVATQGFSFPRPSPRLEAFGLKFTDGGAHISRTMMLAELTDLLAAVPAGALPDDYRTAILERNLLAKTTDSTRKKTLRHMRELYALDDAVPIFLLLRKLALLDRGESLPLLAIQVAWSRDPLLRGTAPPVLDAAIGEPVEQASLAHAFSAAFPGQYSESTLQRTTRNAASSWAQAGHLVGRLHKFRAQVKPTPVAVTMALFLGHVAGYHGGEVFKSPWVRLLDLGADRARTMAMEAHRAGLLNLRSVGDVVDLSFPMLDMIQSEPS